MPAPQIGRILRPSLAETKRRMWLPTGAIDETVDARLAGGSVALSTGVLQVHGGLIAPAGAPITTVTLFSGATPAGVPLNQWVALGDLSRNVLVKSVDKTTEAWAANTAKVFTFASPYISPTDAAIYLCICVVATTPNNLQAAASTTTQTLIVPNLGGNSTSGLTDPASLGATFTTPGGAGARAYAFIS